jgi:hypothetical protein
MTCGHVIKTIALPEEGPWKTWFLVISFRKEVCDYRVIMFGPGVKTFLTF